MLNTKVVVRIINPESNFHGLHGEIDPKMLEAAKRDLTIMPEVFIADFIPTRFYARELEVVDAYN